MKTGWETEEQRLLRFMKMSPEVKLSLLREMNEFLYKASDQKTKALRNKLREHKKFIPNP